MINALTVDVEDYFHPNAMDGVLAPSQWDAAPHRVEPNTMRMLDVLADAQVHATFFVLGWVAERWPQLVREIAARGHEVACHGYAHRLVYQLDRDGFRADVGRARRVIEDALGARVCGFRAASWSIVNDSLWALDILIDEGFSYDSSIFPVHHDLYGIPGFSRFPLTITRPGGQILELPPSTVRFLRRTWPVAGGGYFRLLPYSVTRWAIRSINNQDRRPAMVYVHPWEIDVDQPRLQGKRSSRLRQYTNLHKTEPRLRRLLREFRFAPIREAMRADFAAA